MNMTIRNLAVCCILTTTAEMAVNAAEGGYSNYVAGTYGDFGMALGQLGAHVGSLRANPPIRPGQTDPYEPPK